MRNQEYSLLPLTVIEEEEFMLIRAQGLAKSIDIFLQYTPRADLLNLEVAVSNTVAYLQTNQ